jgi:t-SNARE complex subunit (syntaxin)
VKVHTDIDPLDARKKKYWGFAMAIIAIICFVLIMMFPK